MVYNKIQVAFGALKKINGPPLQWQYNEKQILVISGLDLPEYYAVDFCNEGDADTITMTASAGGVEIPDQFLLTGKKLIAYIVVVDGEAVNTVGQITFPVNVRGRRTDISPEPAEQQQIDSLIGALNDGVSRAETAAEAAEQAETEIETYVERAETAANNAETSASNASSSATNAANSASTATTKANQAASSAQSASQNASAANASAGSAAQSASSARESASAAAGSASNAAGSANAASASAGHAASSAQSASGSASAAAGSAQSASGSATSASQSATNAANSASTASSKAQEAASKATEAGNAKNDAVTAKESAETAQAAAEEAAESIEESAAQIAQNTQDISGVKNSISELDASLATVETTSTASRAYSVGDLLINNNQLYKVASIISAGGTLTPGTNIIATTVETEIARSAQVATATPITAREFLWPQIKQFEAITGYDSQDRMQINNNEFIIPYDTSTGVYQFATAFSGTGGYRNFRFNSTLLDQLPDSDFIDIAFFNSFSTELSCEYFTNMRVAGNLQGTRINAVFIKSDNTRRAVVAIDVPGSPRYKAGKRTYKIVPEADDVKIAFYIIRHTPARSGGTYIVNFNIAST